MQYRSYVIIFVIRPCGKREVGHRPRDVNSDVQRVYNIDDAMLVEKNRRQVKSWVNPQHFPYTW